MEHENMPSLVDLNSEFSNLAVSSETSTPKWVIQKAPIFDPALQDSLVEIINMLDPASFAKLVRTCRTMHHFCFNTKGIAVRCFDALSFLDEMSSKTLDIFMKKDDSKADGVKFELMSRQYRDLKSFSEEEVEKMVKMPFRFHIDHVGFSVDHEITTRHLEALRRYLRRFRRPDVTCVSLDWRTSDWNTFAEIIQDFGVKEFFLFNNAPIPDSLLFFFATNLTLFSYLSYVPDDVILVTTAKTVTFGQANISVHTFKKLLERFVTEEFRDWCVGRPRRVNNGDRRDPFVDACAEVVKVAQVENINFIIKDVGVLYWSPNHPRVFYILRADGTTGVLRILDHIISFSKVFQ